MSDPHLAGLAVAVVAAAIVGDHRVTVAAVGAAILARVPLRHAVVAVVLVAVVVALVGGRLDRLEPVQPGRVEGVATVVRDPESFSGAVRLDVDLGGRVLEAWAWGPTAAVLADLLVGERVAVAGSVRPRGARDDWRLQRGVVGVASLASAAPVEGAATLDAIANSYRRALATGVAHLEAEDRALFAGLVVGDDREQSAALTSDFRRSGLGHLVAVSGQNVVFVLLVLWPLLRLFGIRWRFVVVVVALLWFATVTRFEPSVVRATAMAAVAGAAAALGRSVSPLRVLSLAVIGALCWDPLLARAVGFQLSVAATLGILVTARRLALALPGPMGLRAPVGVTLGAQIGVAPLVLTTFGALPVVSVPANLLAGPAAGFVMVWGSVAGLVAGWLGGDAARWLHLPSRVALWWIRGVARHSADAPVGELDAREAVAVALLGLVGAFAPVVLGRVALWALVVVVVVAIVPARLDSGAGRLGDDVWYVHDGGATAFVVEGSPSPIQILESLRRHHVSSIDVLFVTRGDRRDAELVSVVTSRIPVGVVYAPDGHRVRGARAAAAGSYPVGAHVLVVEATGSGAIDVRLATGGPLA